MARSRASRKEVAEAILKFLERKGFNANVELHRKECDYGKVDYEICEINEHCTEACLEKGNRGTNHSASIR